jgi:toxin ParE1/3/4
VRLNGFRVSRSARLELIRILADSERRFGADTRSRYENLIIQAIRDLGENPERLGTRGVGPRLHYHIRHSRRHVTGGRVGDPRHLLVVKVVGNELFVAAVVHDAMVEGITGRIEEDEGS